MNDLVLLRKNIEHRCIGNDYESIDTTYEFGYRGRVDRGSWFLVKHRKAIGKLQCNWRIFEGHKMRFWAEGNTTDKLKKQIEEDCKNWFDKNGIVWEIVDSTY